MAKSEAGPTRLRLAINILLRLVIVGFAGLPLLFLYDLIWVYDFVRPKTDLYTLFGGVLFPASALVATALAVANKYLWLAAILAILSRIFVTVSCC